MESRILTAITIATLTAATIAAPVHSGRAQVEWLAQTDGYLPGEPVITALKMTLEEGWHTYWINPGEAGMPLSTDVALPAGWTAESPLHPFPIRFKTGDLSDFGYQGTVLFPIILHPPQDGNGDVEIHGTFSWLACDESACVPGDAELSLTLKHSAQTLTAAAPEIAESLRSVPSDAPDGWRLDVTESDDDLKLLLTIPANLNPEQLDVFPLTPGVIQPSAVFQWQRSGEKFSVSVSKSPYAPDPLEALEIVINSPILEQPITVGWSAN